MEIIKKHWSLVVMAAALLIMFGGWYYLHKYQVNHSSGQKTNAQANKKRAVAVVKNQIRAPLHSSLPNHGSNRIVSTVLCFR